MAAVIGPSRNRTLQVAFAILRKGEKEPGKQPEKLITAHPKDEIVRSEPYRRLVAAIPCANCGISGFSQAAHLPPEGKAIKVSDLDTFPLCTVHPAGAAMAEGCHAQFDQYRLIPKEQMRPTARRWIRATQRAILKAGTWPKRIPVPSWWRKKP